MSGTSDDVLVATVDELVRTFHDALVAMIPFAERQRMPWTDDDQHRDWELLASSLFDVFVRGAVDAARDRPADELPLARWDIDRPDYREASWIAVGAGRGPDLAVVRFLSLAEPMDTVQVADVDLVTLAAGPRTTVPWQDATFALVRQRRGGDRQVVTRIEAVE